MKTERDYGYDFAANTGDGPVDINEMCSGSVDIPADDYNTMRNEGIENPNAREYWAGYNSYFAD